MTSRHDAYAAWISEHVPADGDRGQCAKHSAAMVAAFPELKRVRGHYLDPHWGQQPHWWCVAPDGQVVDPTANQFPSRGQGTYVVWDESQEEPTGICPNCGEYAYGGQTCCSDRCHKAYVAYCENPLA